MIRGSFLEFYNNEIKIELMIPLSCIKIKEAQRV